MATVSRACEDAFMTSLLSDLDASIFDEGPSQSPPKSTTLSTSLSTSRSSPQGRQSNAKAPTIPSPGVPRLSQSPVKKRARKAGPSPQKAESRVLTSAQALTNASINEDGDRPPSNFTWSDDDLLSLSPEAKKPLARRRLQDITNVASTSAVRLGEPIKPLAEEKPKISHQCSQLTRTSKDLKKASATRQIYTRCRVEEVHHQRYTPDKYLDAPASLHATKGVRPDTIRKAMQREEIVLDLKVLRKAGEEDFAALGEEAEERRRAHLRDEWLSTDVQKGDYIHLIGEWTEVKVLDRVEIVIDEQDSEEELWSQVDAVRKKKTLHTMVLSSSLEPGSLRGNLLILHPDILLSATAISSVPTCVRKPLLQSKIKSSGAGDDDGPSEEMVMGNMLHEVLQSCLTGREKEMPRELASMVPPAQAPDSDCPFPHHWDGPTPTNFSAPFVKRQIWKQVCCSLENLLSVGLDTLTAMDKLWEKTKPFGQFANLYLSSGQINNQATMIDSRSNSAPSVRVKKVLDVEEDIWSPMYGLKGYVDVSVEVEIDENRAFGESKTPRNATTTTVMPLELKTGRSTSGLEHRAQTMLYTLMMSDRYACEVDAGLLYYSKTGELHRVRATANEVRGLILGRNDLASYLVKRSVQGRRALPPTIDDERKCTRCYVKEACMLYRRAVDGLDKEEDQHAASPLADLYDRTTGHLTQVHADFFKKWDALLTLEETDVVNHRREVWTMSAPVRELRGRCFANMALDISFGETRASGGEGMRHNHSYRFVRRAHTYLNGSDNSLLNGNLSVGDPVMLSIEPDTVSVAQGYILELSPLSVVVGVDHDLKRYVDRHIERGDGSNPLFRIDKEELAGGMGRVRYNLSRLFMAPPMSDEKRRRLIVDLEAPRFVCSTRHALLPSALNDDQQAAVAKVLAAQDYALIVGMPGTGKTTSVAELIKLLVKEGQSVLLTSYTHSAVDTICRKLKEAEMVRLLRLGNEDKVHEDVRGHLLPPAKTVEQLQERIMAPNVVATTCLSLGHTLFSKRKFDYCIVDEASQITLPTCLGPLRFADKFVLVGDPQQLPPLVKSAKAKEGGLDVSLFSRLADAHPQSMVYLTRQYRMSSDIMDLSNHVTYGGRLRCGDESFANLQLTLPVRVSSSSGKPWLDRVLFPSTRVVFLDTDKVPAPESRVGELVQNVIEAKLVQQVARALLAGGVEPKDVAVIAPLRQQLKLIGQQFDQEKEKGIEVMTADRAQGRDKSVIIVSFVRSQQREEGAPMTSLGELLNDERRINVALTRAQKKLVIIGSRSTLKQSALLAKMLAYMNARDWIVALPPQAHLS